MKTENFAAGTVVFFALLGIAALVGWGLNIVKLLGLVGQSFDVVAVEMFIRGVGIFVAPLGAVAGYF